MFGAFQARAYASVAPFDPLSVTGAFSYYDMDHVTLSGSNLATVADRSGNGRTITSFVGTIPLTASWRNGRGAWLQAGAIWCNEPAYPSVQGQPISYVFVGQWPSVSASGRTIAQAVSVNNTAPMFQNGGGLIRAIAGGSDQTYLSTPAALLNQPFVAVVTLNGASSKLRIWYQGGVKTSNTIAATPGANGQGTMIWGAANGGALPWGAYLATKGMWSRTLTTPEEDYLLQGLCDYYGIVPL